MNAKQTVEALKGQLAKAKLSLDEQRSRRKILCSCGRMHMIKQLELLITHWYVEPYSCSGGDYWREGEWQFVCPVDQTRNRLLFDDYDVEYKQREVVNIAAGPTFKSLYRGLFKSEKSTYKDDENAWQNNGYVDQNRKRFELPEKILG